MTTSVGLLNQFFCACSSPACAHALDQYTNDVLQERRSKRTPWVVVGVTAPRGASFMSALRRSDTNKGEWQRFAAFFFHALMRGR